MVAKKLRAPTTAAADAFKYGTMPPVHEATADSEEVEHPFAEQVRELAGVLGEEESIDKQLGALLVRQHMARHYDEQRAEAARAQARFIRLNKATRTILALATKSKNLQAGDPKGRKAKDAQADIFKEITATVQVALSDAELDKNEEEQVVEAKRNTSKIIADAVKENADLADKVLEKRQEIERMVRETEATKREIAAIEEETEKMKRDEAAPLLSIAAATEMQARVSEIESHIDILCSMAKALPVLKQANPTWLRKREEELQGIVIWTEGRLMDVCDANEVLCGERDILKQNLFFAQKVLVDINRALAAQTTTPNQDSE